ncbi:MAG: B-box zinc finger protein [Bryobacteraceae bacterium]|nr:B-box zinc finger protein [Bryobacteraceae bacterium]
MNCLNHPDLPAVAYCRMCGKALCEACRRTVGGTIYCEEHLPVPATPSTVDAGLNPYAAPYPAAAAPPVVDASVSPGLAFLLGLIPGVGAIYNGQYAKGLVHVVIFGLLISLLNSPASAGLEPLFGMLLPAWVFYMAFEAYHTARKRQMGIVVDEFSSLIPMKGSNTGFPVAPIVLIALGVLFLLHNLDILRIYHLLRYWPVGLIALGVYLLYIRVTGSPVAPPQEATNERP